MQPLIKKKTNVGENDMEDCIMLIAAKIEDSLMDAGAKPGQDYTLLDLYKLALPFVVHRFQKGELKNVW